MSTMWSDTLLLMLMGMGTVFFFLVALIVSLKVLSIAVDKFAPAEQLVDVAVVPEQEIAAIAAAAYFHYKK